MDAKDKKPVHKGRQKGTPNKDKAALLAKIREAVGDDEYHPVIEMARIGAEDIEGITDPVAYASAKQIKFTANKEVAPYISAKLKSVEVKTDEDSAFGVLVVPAVLSEKEYIKRCKVVKELNSD